VNKFQLKAVQIAAKVLRVIKPRVGMTEKQLAQEIKTLLGKHGARSAFRILVGSGKNSAVPHCCPKHKKIKTGELVIVDFGANYKGYCSDLTRTFVMGNPDKRKKMLLKVIRTAQARAIKIVKEGRRCFEVDQQARDYIKRQCVKYCGIIRKNCPGDCFIHSTGHGIGRKVHQAPKISLRNKNRLKAGQVITVEPGIYIKGWGGIRIEDMVLVTKRGARVLT
jgi:Xaa-Pro aminopeptidase